MEAFEQINQETFITTITTWYKNNRRSFSWREHITPYHVVVSEIMLQQTTVEVVIPYYNRFLKTLPSLEDVAKVSEAELLKLLSAPIIKETAALINKLEAQIS